jgi:predicted flap endonuclease-1-like 5' DNA nuclease
MPYHIDFSAMTLADLKARLLRSDLIPSQLPLLDGIDRKLAAIKKAGVATLEDLSAALRGAKGPAALSAKSGVAEDYLILVRRTIEGFRPKPVKLPEYPSLAPAIVAALAAMGIGDSKELYEAAPDAEAQAALAKRAGIPAASVRELLCLADLSRMQWVGATFARVLYEAGYRSPADIAAAKAEDVYESVSRANEDAALYKGKIGLRDMGRLVSSAKELA